MLLFFSTFFDLRRKLENIYILTLHTHKTKRKRKYHRKKCCCQVLMRIVSYLPKPVDVLRLLDTCFVSTCIQNKSVIMYSFRFNPIKRKCFWYITKSNKNEKRKKIITETLLSLNIPISLYDLMKWFRRNHKIKLTNHLCKINSRFAVHTKISHLSSLYLVLFDFFFLSFE